VETLDLDLRGYQSYISTSYHPREYAQESISLEATTAPEPERGSWENPVKTWIAALNNDLAQLAIVAQQAHRLHTLRIRAWSSPSPEPLSSPEDYMSLPTMQALLSVENLSVLVLHLSGSFLLNSSGQQGSGCHICPAIAALLGTLRTLHLRMRSICPDVLKPRDLDDRLHLHLSAVVINLSLVTNLPGITSAAHSKRCGSGSRGGGGGGLIQLKADMQEQAEALATRMASPKIMRILTHSLLQFDTQSLDVLTGKLMMLDDAVAWDEDGKTVQEDSEPESELLDEEELSCFPR
jgi:hypothetical protein